MRHEKEVKQIINILLCEKDVEHDTLIPISEHILDEIISDLENEQKARYQDFYILKNGGLITIKDSFYTNLRYEHSVRFRDDSLETAFQISDALAEKTVNTALGLKCIATNNRLTKLISKLMQKKCFAPLMNNEKIRLHIYRFRLRMGLYMYNLKFVDYIQNIDELELVFKI